jgi:hypothetical protein
MPEGRRRPSIRWPQLAAATVVGVTLWLVARGREPARATVPVDDAHGRYPARSVHAVVEGPAASLLTLRIHPPVLRDDVRAGARALTPRDVDLPEGMDDVTVRAVVLRPTR